MSVLECPRGQACAGTGAGGSRLCALRASFLRTEPGLNLASEPFIPAGRAGRLGRTHLPLYHPFLRRPGLCARLACGDWAGGQQCPSPWPRAGLSVGVERTGERCCWCPQALAGHHLAPHLLVRQPALQGSDVATAWSGRPCGRWWPGAQQTH